MFIDWPETGLEDINGNVPEDDLQPLMRPGLGLRTMLNLVDPSLGQRRDIPDANAIIGTSIADEKRLAQVRASLPCHAFGLALSQPKSHCSDPLLLTPHFRFESEQLSL